MTSAHPHVDALAIALAVSHGLDELAPAQVSATMARTAQRHAIKAARTCWRDAVRDPDGVPFDADQHVDELARSAHVFALEVLSAPGGEASGGDTAAALRALRAAFRTWAAAATDSAREAA